LNIFCGAVASTQVNDYYGVGVFRAGYIISLSLPCHRHPPTVHPRYTLVPEPLSQAYRENLLNIHIDK